MVSRKENIDDDNNHELIARYPKTLWIYNNNINNDYNTNYNLLVRMRKNEQ